MNAFLVSGSIDISRKKTEEYVWVPWYHRSLQDVSLRASVTRTHGDRGVCNDVADKMLVF